MDRIRTVSSILAKNLKEVLASGMAVHLRKQYEKQ